MISAALLEAWIEFGFAALLTIIRMAIRIYTVGVCGLRSHDYITVFTLILFCVACVLVQLIAQAYSDMAVLAALPETKPAQLAALSVLANKYSFASFCVYPTFLYSAKAALIAYYNTFTTPIWQQRRLTQLSILSDNWDVTSPRLESCQSSSVVTIVLFVCHMIKLFIGSMLCSGIFTIVAAIVVFKMFMNVSDPASLVNGARWSRREQLMWMLLLSVPSIVSIFKGRILTKTTTTYGSMLGAEDKDEEMQQKGTPRIAERS
ncbi:hypothetical protein BP6252_11624 [Coleophoma cylindrospora]|uniref:Uncharacterized protein n=1 Tax=Coleophoma cylindrospora TaxID=1849047 RepID=A0A3D8QKE7_9HELO|nr:hypothetical protein BP6252_11624 [Coleophoma cylindrospora]